MTENSVETLRGASTFTRTKLNSTVEIRIMKRGELLKSFRIRKVTTVSKNGTIKSKSKKNSPPIQRRNFGSFARYAHRVEDLG